MSNTVVLQTRIDAQDKARAEEILHDLGLDFTSAVRMFVKQIINQETIPFVLQKPDDFWNEEHLEMTREAINDYRSGKYQTHELLAKKQNPKLGVDRNETLS